VHGSELFERLNRDDPVILEVDRRRKLARDYARED
jgi:hypothetical protein